MIILFSMQISMKGQHVKVGVYQNPPKVFTDTKGNPQGIFIDILDEIARIEKIEIQYIEDSWSNHLINLSEGDIELLPVMAFNTERDSLYSFNKIPVIQSWIQIFCKEDKIIREINDLDNKDIGVLKGSVQHKYLLHEFPASYTVNINPVIFETYEESVNALKDESIDAILASRFFYFSDLRKDKIVPTALVFQTRDLFFATKKGENQELLNIIDRHLCDMKNTPGSVYYESLNTWLASPEDFRLPYSFILFLIIILTSLLLIIFHVIVLRRKIKAKIAELKETSEHLEIEEKNYREIFNASRDGIFIHDYDTGEILDMNQTILDMFGYDSKEIIGSLPPDKIFDIEGGFTPDLVRKKLAEARQKGQVTFEWRGKRKDGSVFWIEMTLNKAHIGESIRILAFARDIDDKKRIEKEAEKATALFHNMAMNSPVGIFRTDTAGDTIFVNPAWTKMTSLSAEQAIGSGWLKIIHPDDREKIISEWKERVKQRVPSRAEYRIVRPDGSLVWVLGYAVPDFMGNQFNGYVGTMTDVTELKEAEIQIQKTNEDLRAAKEKAEESNRLKSSFLANLSHEIRTPMNSIAGFASLLSQSEYSRKDITRFATIIQQSTDQLLTIINDIIEISLIETGQMTLRYEELHISDFFSHLNTIYSNQIPDEKNIKIIFNVPEPSGNIKVYTDRVKFEQIFINLINNAFKYTDVGHILVDCHQLSSELLVFSVSDTGIGIDPSEHELVFERFYRCENKRAHEIKGSGLGLSIMKAYVEMLGGKVGLESSPGKGSKFYFYFPLYHSVSVSGSADNRSHINLKHSDTLNILIVDDEELNVLFLQNALAEFNANITVTSKASEAIELSRINKFNIILMDVRLEDGSGIDATRVIKDISPESFIIVQTAYTLAEDEQRARDAGCDEFLAKPISLKKLRTIFEKYLSQPS